MTQRFLFREGFLMTQYGDKIVKLLSLLHCFKAIQQLNNEAIESYIWVLKQLDQSGQL